MTATGTTKGQPSAEAGDRVATIGAAVADMTGTAKTVATDVAAHLPEVATTTRNVIGDANREMQAGSDEMLVVGSALTFGLAGGLLIGGGHRLLVAAALMPAAMMLLTVFERSVRTGDRSRRTPQGS